MKKTTLFRRLFVPVFGLGIVLGLGAYFSQAADPTGGEAVALREIGSLKVTPRYYGAEPNRSSWITMKAKDKQKAKECASKYLEDLLEFGEVKLDPALPGTRLSLEGAGWWALGLDGKSFHVVFSRSKEELSTLLKTANATKWQAIPRGDYPKWLDCFDTSAMTFWFSGFGVLPTDIPADLKWYADNKFTLCAVMGNTERRLVAPSILDTSIMDWQSAAFGANRIPYKTMAEMASPGRPECLWNYTPLPYYLPADGQLTAAQLPWQGLAMHASFQAGAVTDHYLSDFRRRVGDHLNGDPYFSGHHVMQEMPSGDPRSLLSLAAVAGTPAIQELWRTYLRDTLNYDLKEVGSKHYGDPKTFPNWSDVKIPSLKEFLVGPSPVIDLKGTWQGRADRDKKAGPEKWLEDSSSDQWVPVDFQDQGLMIYAQGEGCDYYLRKTFTVSAENLGDKYFHMARMGFMDGPANYDLWINGQKLDCISCIDPSCPDWDMCYDASKALKLGENVIVLNTRGVPFASYAFLSDKGRWVYPSPSETLNRRYFDLLAFNEWLCLRELENRMIAIRAGEPNRPMKIMAPHQYIDSVLDLCAKYGAYPHDTGSAAAYWAPFNYSRYAFTRGIPNSVEEGGPPKNAGDMQAFMTRYLMMGADMVDNVGHCTLYTKNEGINAWITENRELLRCIGKLDLVQPSIGILRSPRELLMGHREMYSWDMGRGPLASIGRAFNYATLGDVKSGRANKFKVLLDCATAVLSDEDVAALEQYVRQGGIFVAFHNTGMHTPDKANSWPISKLTGLRVLNENRPIGGTKIHFTDTQGLWPKLRGQEVNGWGFVYDYKKEDQSGAPLALAAQNQDIEVVAEWKNAKMDGSIAVAIRALGKGKVITLGSTFYRNGKDENGRYVEEGTLPYLDELLTSLGVPRDMAAGDLWGERWRSKNGVYDVYPIAQMNSAAVPGATDVHIRRDTPISSLWELSALNHPVRQVAYSDGMLTIPQVKMEAMQCRVFAAPRKDLEDAALHWLEMQKKYWGKLPAIPAAEVKLATVEPASDVIPLVEGWQSSTGEKSPAWVQPTDSSAKEWKPVKLGSFAAMGLPEDAVAQFRKEVVLPKEWKDQRVALVFNTEIHLWGIGMRGRLWINGEPAAIKQPLQPNPEGSFVIELTPAQLAEKSLVFALEVDGRLPDKKNQAKPRPSGVTGTFFLRTTPQPVLKTTLTQWAVASDLNKLTPAAVGQTVEGMYLETKFTLPDKWPGKKLSVQSQESLGSLFINNQYISAPKWMCELDVSGLVKREGENVLRWVPAKSSPSYSTPYKGKVPQMNLLWQN